MLMEGLMTEIDGIKGLRRIKTVDPNARIVMLSMSADDK
jgi:DNA-binding NarL/FixJ family response regulator